MKLHGIEITHPDKVIFPKIEATKADMAQYYSRIADYMLPYLKDRPLTLQRFPDGIDQEGFYQKNASDYFPDFIERIEIKTKEGSNRQVICNSKKTLMYLVNQGTVAFHIWLSRKDQLNQPDKVIFDLDPPENSFDRLKDAARKLRNFLQIKGREPKLMTTGKSGFHVFYYKRRNQNFDEVRKQAHEEADELARKYPDLFTTETRINKRQARIFVDYLRNAYGQTGICPFSLRPIPSAGVATPLRWDELGKTDSARQYHIKNIFRRLGQQ